jgi:hypothetical protein
VKRWLEALCMKTLPLNSGKFESGRTMRKDRPIPVSA